MNNSRLNASQYLSNLPQIKCFVNVKIGPTFIRCSLVTGGPQKESFFYTTKTKNVHMNNCQIVCFPLLACMLNTCFSEEILSLYSIVCPCSRRLCEDSYVRTHFKALRNDLASVFLAKSPSPVIPLLACACQSELGNLTCASAVFYTHLASFIPCP